MNKQDRKALTDMLYNPEDKLQALQDAHAVLDALSTFLQEMSEEEMGKYEEMPEGLQNSDRGQQIMEAAGCLEEAAGAAEEAMTALDELEDKMGEVLGLL